MELTPVPLPVAQEQRSSGKRPLPDAPGSASGSEAKRTRHPCAGGIATPRGLVPLLAPKKALRVSSTSAGRTATPPAASGGVTRETAEPTAEVAPTAATGGVVLQPGTGQGLTPAPPSASSADLAGQGIAPGGPPTGEVIDLDDEAEEERAAPTVVAETGAVAPATVTGTAVATEERESAPAAMTGTAAAGEVRTPVPVAAAEVGTSAQEAVAKATVAAEAGVPTPAATTGERTPASVVATKAAAVAGTGMPAPAAAMETVAAADGSGRTSASMTAAVTSTRMAAHAPGPLTRPAASGVAVLAPAATSRTAALRAAGAASTLVSVNPIPKAWSGTTLRWMSRDDPQRPLFTLDNAEE
ncbi:nucleoporin NSP1-like [Setaria italica]|uniref:nucleoporin NSP1-like n=1 Tax=Setaria italica TaxID=4555 RepID=UPI00035125DF|nr:nucleoporin NSP1-like [Setaria italica]